MSLSLELERLLVHIGSANGLRKEARVRNILLRSGTLYCPL
jgi:hypothetical protein